MEAQAEHVQEDIVLRPQPVITCYRHGQAFCQRCHRPVVQAGEGELLHAPIGPVAKSVALYLRYRIGISYRKTAEVFREVFGLTFVPASALVLPLFLELSLVGLVGSPWAVILPTAFFPFGVYLAYVFYATSIPRDLLAAGRVDGCSEWQLFRFVCLPISKTLIGLLTFLSFTANWNNYFLPFVMLNDDQTYTLAVGLQSLVTGTSMVSMSAIRGTSSVMKSPEGALMGLLMVLPLTLVFIVSQRYVIRGALTGSIKG